MNTRRASWLLCVLALLAFGCCAQTPNQGLNHFELRGRVQSVYFYAGAGSGPHKKVLFAPGDGGWHGFAIDIARQIADSGYDVFGIDTRIYLEGFTGGALLKPADIASDFRQLANWIQQGSNGPVLLVGWSEGAGLSIAALADPQSHAIFSGLVAVGTTEYNILAWRWRDIGAEVLKTLPNEPTFRTIDFIAAIAPLPIAMISATHDEYVSVDAVQKIFGAARDPKKLIKIDAEDHKFRGATDVFFKDLNEALDWILQQHK